MGRNSVIIIQARVGAVRLPHKVMLPLHGFPIIEWVFRRVRRTKLADKVLVAIPETKENEELEKILKRLGAEIYRGNENDLVDRFYQAANLYEATHIIRVCADNPFISATEIDHLINFFFSENCDYAYNHLPRNNSYPDGLGAEMVSFETLKTLHNEARLSDHREHIFNFIWTYPERFKIGTFSPEDHRLAHPELKLDVDTQLDYQRLQNLAVNINMEAHEIVTAALTLNY